MGIRVRRARILASGHHIDAKPPGDYGLDWALGLDLGWLAVPALVGAVLGIAAALLTRNRPRPSGVGQGEPAEEATRPV